MNGLMMDRQLLLSSLLWRTERLFGDKRIHTRLDDGAYHSYTYREYGQRVRRLANALWHLGVRHGDRVGTLGWNHHRHLETYFAVPATGAVLHTVNLRLFREQQRFTIDHVGDSVLFVDPDQIPVVEELVELGIPTVRAFVVMGDGPVPETSLAPVHSYEELLAAESDDYEYPEFDEHEAAAICFTSATTGDPKGVVYSHRAMVLQALCLGLTDDLGLREDQVWLEVAPMFHVNGWNIPHAALLQGATLVLPGVHPKPTDLVAAVEDLGVTGINAAVTVGTLLRDAVEESDRHHDLSTLRTMWLGGQAPSTAIMQWWGERGTTITQGWGMTENSPQICFSGVKSTLRATADEDDLRALRQKQGLPLPLVQIRVVGEDGSEQPWDGESVGDLWVRSPFTASAYFADERTAESMVDGWFRTGDIGAVDADGYVVLKDRAKDLIKSGGEWISSIDLENALMAHPDVREATVVNIPDEKWLERPLACVVPRNGSLREEDLKTHLAQDFAKWSIPDRFVFVAEIPKSGVGKYDKKAVRALHAEGGDAAIRSTLGTP